MLDTKYVYCEKNQQTKWYRESTDQSANQCGLVRNSTNHNVHYVSIAPDKMFFVNKKVLIKTSSYEGPAKSFVTRFELLQCYILSNIFLLQTFKVFPLYWNTFVTFLPSREKQVNSLLSVSAGDTDK